MISGRNRLRDFAWMAGLLALYYPLGRLGLATSGFAHGNATLVWPPTGLALAALVLGGRKLWPAVWIGGFLVNLSTGVPLATSLAVGTGNALEAVVGAALLERVRFRTDLGRLRDVAALVGLAAVGATSISALFGAAGLCAFGAAPWASFPRVLWVWWAGDAMSVIGLTPALLVWSRVRWRPRSGRRFLEALAIGVGTLLVAAAVFLIVPYGAPLYYPVAYLVFPFPIWSALRFGTRGASATTLATFAVAIWGTAQALGPFAFGTINQRLLMLHLFLAVLALTSVGLAAALEQMRAGEAALRDRDEQLRQARKMEAIGRLAGGVAHDFNNLLTVITGFADLALDRLGRDHPSRGDVEEIRAAAHRGASFTRQLLAFSRKQLVQPKVVDLNRIVAGMDGLLTALLGETVRLDIRRSPDLGAVRIDPAQAEQIVMNLVVNARDAMPEGGTIVLETHDLTVAPSAATAGRPAGRFATLVVADSGVGMDSATLERIYEPFFTTKDAGAGTGLGLATVYGIVIQSGGTIHAESTPGRGSRFEVRFPVVDGLPDEVAIRDPAPHGGGETVLVVEDEAAVRSFVARVLSREGYRVLEAAGPREALALAEREPRIDALLTDIVMPNGTGTALAGELRSRRPALPVAFMSGYTEERVVEDAARYGDEFLAKPFTSEALLRTVRRTLERAGP